MIDFDKNFEKYLNLYLDGRLDKSEAEAFEKYLLENPEKAGELDAYKTLDYTAKGEKLPDLPKGYWEGLNTRINSRIAKIDIEKSGWRKFWAFMRGEMFSFHRGMKYAAAVVSIALVILISRNIMYETSPTEFARDRTLEEGKEEVSYITKPAKEPITESAIEMDVPVDAEESEAIKDDMAEKKALGGEELESGTEQLAKKMASPEEEEPKAIAPGPVEDTSLEEVRQIKGGFDTENGDKKLGVISKPEGTDEIRLDDMTALPEPQVDLPAVETEDIEKTIGVVRKGKGDEVQLSSTDEIAIESRSIGEDSAIPDSIAVFGEEMTISIEMEPATPDDYQIAIPLTDSLAVDSLTAPDVMSMGELQSIQMAGVGVDTSGVRLPDSLLSKMSDTGEYRRGEDELDTTLYHYDAVRAKRSPSDMTLDDFPQLSRVKYGFIEETATPDGDGITVMANQPEPALAESEESLRNMRKEGDRLLSEYERTLVPEVKALLFMDIINQYLKVSRLSKDSRDINRCQKLLRTASQMGLMTFRESEAYTDSLDMIRRDK